MNVINKITARSPPISKRKTQVLLGIVGFWRIFIPNYSPFYQLTWKKNYFIWALNNDKSVNKSVVAS